MEIFEENNISDKELIQHCIKNNRHYQEILYRRYADKMYSVCLTYSENDDDACDILQDGFIKVFRKLHKYSFEGSFEGWIRRIIVNTAIELYRKKKREKEVFMQYHNTISPKNFNEILDKISARELIKLVNKLPFKAGLVLKLFAIEGYSHIEIAKQLGITTGTSKSQLNRARTLLKEYINNIDDR